MDIITSKTFVKVVVVLEQIFLKQKKIFIYQTKQNR